MLSANVIETPRPRPPAKIRRSSALLKASTPPPSYASAFDFTPEGRSRPDTLLGSPMAATFKRVEWENATASRDQLSPASEEDLEWIHEKSREELSDLLIKADDLIKERENELGLASAVCKNLYDSNVTLKTKHQALLARLPSSPSPSSSPSLSPEPLSRTPSRYSISLSRPVSELNPVSYKTHARKISVSTSEISHLADQNAELLDKLEKLESESFSADQSGRRVLKRLEKEIATLREELEKTQAKSEELEEKAKAGFGWDSEKVVEEVWRKKREREAKFRAMRNLGQGSTNDDEGEYEIRDFAPEGSTFGGPSPGFSFFPSGETPRRLSGTPLHRPAFSTRAPAHSTPHPESSLISKLLVKIQELEDANTRIIEQQNETTQQLNAMQQETEHISRVYECFGDENVIELAADKDFTSEEVDSSSRDETIRFRSFKRNLTAQHSQTSLNKPLNDTVHSPNPSAITKARKSVVGLFDEVSDDQAIGAPRPDQLRTLNIPIPFSSTNIASDRSSQPLGSNGLVSPALSSLSLSPNQSPGQNPFRDSHPTLDAELGNELGDGWGISTGNHHLRTSSLYDLTQMSAPPSPSPSPSRMSLDRSHGASQEQESLPTPMSMGNVALRLSVEPPTPDKIPTGAGGSMGRQSARYQLMSQTVRSRTNRWVDGRFKDTLTGDVQSDRSIPEDTHRPLTPLPLRLSSAFDEAVENFTGRTRESAEDPSLSDDENQIQLHVDKAAKKPRGLGSVMLEIWMWLQFAIIILVFLWTMAKRGPKSVLGEPQARQRRVASIRK